MDSIIPTCFVIMPYAKDYSDVYQAIRLAGQRAKPAVYCWRLDDRRDAGRIIGRLEQGIREADFCIADVTGCNSNVMWELGFSMSAGKPAILISQDEASLPFDLKDVHKIKYDRMALAETLQTNLIEALAQTATQMNLNSPIAQRVRRLRVVEKSIRKEIQWLTDANEGSFQSTYINGNNENNPKLAIADKSEFQILTTNFNSIENSAQIGEFLQPHEISEQGLGSGYFTGAWINNQTGTCMYLVDVDGRLVAPYCYGGDDELTGVYYDGKTHGDSVFLNYLWVDDESERGFAFYKKEDEDTISGTWWSATADTLNVKDSEAHLASWRRLKGKETPEWATEFLERVRKDGLEEAISARL